MNNMDKPTLTFRNPTKYFDKDRSQLYITVGNPSLYTNKKTKIEGYETRLYYEFLNNQEQNGQTFFYTLTYNDKAMPTYYGYNCFDYEDLRYLLNGGFKKMLLRKYGTDLKYFVGAELGEGKGKRGYANNPHYHVLFFLYPTNNPKYEYRKIDPSTFKDLVQIYWQGFADSMGYHDYNNAKFGIACPGQHNGLVNSVAAAVYCAKYVTKDVRLKEIESKIFKNEYPKFYEEHINNRMDKYNYVMELINKGTLKMSDISATIDSVLLSLGISSEKDIDIIVSYVDSYLYEEFLFYCDSLAKIDVKAKINEFKNRYSNKCRISQGVGLRALKDINYLEPKVAIVTKKGIKNRPLCGYYYRKLYYDVKKDPITNNNVYRLNTKGLEYKVHSLPDRIKKVAESTLNDLNSLCNEDVFESYKKYNPSCPFPTLKSFKDYMNRYNVFDSSRESVTKYAAFTLIYKGRMFNSAHPISLNYVDDLIDFSTDTSEYIDYNDYGTQNFIKLNSKIYLPYTSHPDFIEVSNIFSYLDDIRDFFLINKAQVAFEKDEKYKKIKEFHSKLMFKSKYNF